MAGRAGGHHLNRAQQLEIGTQVARARAIGVEWKVLVQVYNRDRTVLYRYMVRSAAVFCNTISELCNTFPSSETA